MRGCMNDVPVEHASDAFSIPGAVAREAGNGNLPKVSIRAPEGSAEVYLRGAQVTAFQKKGDAPLLFLSGLSQFTHNKAIRGGVPICFPWFGPRAGDAAHGFARITDWEISKTEVLEGVGVRAAFTLPGTPARQGWPSFRAEFIVTVDKELTLELVVTNTDSSQPFEFDNCFHTYFAVGDISQIAISGLENAEYFDHTKNDAARREPNEPIRITAQTDRVYLDNPASVQIVDPVLRRRILISKSGSVSTVVWNPWTTQPLSDLGPEEYRRMVCVESGNVGRNRIKLAPGAVSRLKVILATRPL